MLISYFAVFPVGFWNQKHVVKHCNDGQPDGDIITERRIELSLDFHSFCYIKEAENISNHILASLL